MEEVTKKQRGGKRENAGHKKKFMGKYDKVNSVLKFYRNMRDEIYKDKGELYNLKKEFDLLEKDKIAYIKESGIIIINLE